MLELFVEMTNQVFWEGYAQQLSIENPAVFRFRFKQFIDSYDQGQTSGSNTQSYFVKIIKKNYHDSLSKQLQA